MKTNIINGIDIERSCIGGDVICPLAFYDKGLLAVVTPDDDASDDVSQFFDLGRVFPDAEMSRYGDGLQVAVIHRSTLTGEAVETLLREHLTARGYDPDEILQPDL